MGLIGLFKNLGIFRVVALLIGFAIEGNLNLCVEFCQLLNFRIYQVRTIRDFQEVIRTFLFPIWLLCANDSISDVWDPL